GGARGRARGAGGALGAGGEGAPDAPAPVGRRAPPRRHRARPALALTAQPLWSLTETPSARLNTGPEEDVGEEASARRSVRLARVISPSARSRARSRQRSPCSQLSSRRRVAPRCGWTSTRTK